MDESVMVKLKKVVIYLLILLMWTGCTESSSKVVGQHEVEPLYELVSGSTRKISQIAGDYDFQSGQLTPNQTITRYNLMGTDGGNSFEYDGKLWFFFGDSDHIFPVSEDMENLNAMAWATVEDPENLTLQFLTDTERIPGKTVWLAPILVDAQGQEKNLQAFNTQLDGFSDGDDLYVLWSQDFMSRSVLSKTDDPTAPFKIVYDLGDSHFINVDAVGQNDIEIPGLEEYGRTDWILFYGSGTVKNKHVYMAVTPRDRLREGDRDAVYFLSGYDFSQSEPVLNWSKDEDKSVRLFEIEGNGFDFTMGPFHSPWGGTEPNVFFVEKLNLYFAVYTDLFTVRLRTANSPWGPWTDPITIFVPWEDYGYGPAFGTFLHNPELADGKTLKPGDCAGGEHHPLCDRIHDDGHEADGGGVYGAWVIEKFLEVSENGEITLYYLLSTQNPYNVVLLTSRLQKR